MLLQGFTVIYIIIAFTNILIIYVPLFDYKNE